MATQKGTVGTVFGIPGTTTITVNSKTHEVIRSYNYSKEADNVELRNNTGDVINLTHYNQRERVTLDVLISDTTNMAGALTDFNALPAVGDLAEIASASGDTQIVSAGDASNDWIVESASKVATQDDYGTMSLGLVRYSNDLDAIS